MIQSLSSSSFHPPKKDQATLHKLLWAGNADHIVPYGTTQVDEYVHSERVTTDGFTLPSGRTFIADPNDQKDDGVVTLIDQNGKKITLTPSNVRDVINKLK